MWRAWGVALLVLSQDLSPAARSEDHEFTIRPPQGWVRKPGVKPTVVKWVVGEEGKAAAELLLTHLVSGNPTPLKNFETQARQHLAERYKGAKVAEEKTVTVGGRPAHRLVFSHEGVLYLKLAIHRTNLEYYMLDALLQEAHAAKYRSAVEASMATFEIVPTPLSGDEQDALARAVGVLKSSKIDPALLGERWHAIHLGNLKTGHQRTKVGESAGLYTFEMDVESDYGQGKKDVAHVRGSFSPDGRTQKIDTEQTKANEKERWQFRASAVLQNGQVKATRDLNGVKEEKSFAVEEGVLFVDVADILRGVLAAAGKGAYLIRTISPYADEPNVELIEVGEAERLDFDGKPRDVILAQSRVDRLKYLTFTYSASDRSLLRLGGAKDAFSIRAATKEEALK
jgi:hypothetical protein